MSWLFDRRRPPSIRLTLEPPPRRSRSFHSMLQSLPILYSDLLRVNLCRGRAELRSCKGRVRYCRARQILRLRADLFSAMPEAAPALRSARLVQFATAPARTILAIRHLCPATRA